MFKCLILLLVLQVALVAGKAAVTDVQCPQMNECPLNCMFGYAVNKDGCAVCECQDGPCSESGTNCRFPKKVVDHEKECEETDTCAIVPVPGVCPDQVCQTFCQFGFVKGNSGCPVCKCNPEPCKGVPCNSTSTCEAKEEKCLNPPCPWKGECVPSCQELECTNDCPSGFKKDKDGCQTCECAKDYCEGVQCPVNQVCVSDPRTRDFNRCECEKKTCDLKCPFGLARDANGCETCKCVTDPCQSIVCLTGVCLPIQEKSCLVAPCPYKANCVIKQW